MTHSILDAPIYQPPIFTDWLDAPITVGAKIIYPVRTGSSTDVVLAEVVSIDPLVRDHQRNYVYRHRDRHKDPWERRTWFYKNPEETKMAVLNVRPIRRSDRLPVSGRTAVVERLDRVTVVG